MTRSVPLSCQTLYRVLSVPRIVQHCFEHLRSQEVCMFYIGDCAKQLHLLVQRCTAVTACQNVAPAPADRKLDLIIISFSTYYLPTFCERITLLLRACLYFLCMHKRLKSDALY